MRFTSVIPGIPITSVVPGVPNRVAERAPGVPTTGRPLATLGPVTFQLVGPLVGLQSTRAYTFAEHARVTGKPSLQTLGEELERSMIEFQFLHAFCEPDAAFAELVALAARREAVPFVWANGVVRGRYVITQLEETTASTNTEGQSLRRSGRMELLEWVEPPRSAETPARSTNAPAVGAPSPSSRIAAPRRPSRGANPRTVSTRVITRRP